MKITGQMVANNRDDCDIEVSVEVTGSLCFRKGSSDDLTGGVHPTPERLIMDSDTPKQLVTLTDSDTPDTPEDGLDADGEIIDNDVGLNEAQSSHSQTSDALSSNNSIGPEGGQKTDGTADGFTYWPYGFQLRASYEHSKKNTDIMGVTYNSRMRQFVILDSKGITTWSKDAIEHCVQRSMSYPKYEYRLITSLVYARKYNVYFILSKDFSVKVFNRDFEETCRVSADLRSVLFILFNPVRDELITGGVGGTKVWRYHQASNRTWKEIKPMANYKLTLKHELKRVGGSWVKKVELDMHQQHLYCCSDTDLQAYDMDGNILFKFDRAHAMSITGCAYSITAALLVTASADTQVKAWSIAGGLVHTFRGHSRAITDLVLHPELCSLVLTSSLDGTVRIWSLDTMESLYSLVVSTEGVRWMGLTDDRLLYLSTKRTLTVWSLNTSTTFWSLARCCLTRLLLVPGYGKSTRLVAVGEDSSVRILSRMTQKTVSMVMPPPVISPLSRIGGVVHIRDYNVTYLLINSQQLWVYTNKTDPACRVAVWDLLDIQTRLLTESVHAAQHSNSDKEKGKDKRPSSAVFGMTGAAYRATVEGSGSETVAKCRCICYLRSPAMVWTEEGPCCPIQHDYLLLGLEDGRILFMDPVVRGKRYLDFRANKDAILDMVHDVEHETLMTRCDLGDAALIQLWRLPHLMLQHEVYCPSDVTVFARLGCNLLTGHESGSLIHHTLTPVEDSNSVLKPKFVHEGIAGKSVQHEKTENSNPVTAMDVCVPLRIFVTASPDGCVKVWDETKVLVSELQLETSLTSLCFLNRHGDLLVAFKNHIFFIDRSKVYPRGSSDQVEEEDEEDEPENLDDLSNLTDLGVSVEPVSMESYLVPYKILLAADPVMPSKVPFVDSASEEKLSPQDEEQLEPAPSEIYESPRLTPLSLSLIDLTLSREVTEFDLQALDEKSEELKEEKPRPKLTPKQKKLLKKQQKLKFGEELIDPKLGVEMPQFGESPCPSPTLSSFSDPGTPNSWFSVSTGGRSTLLSNLSWYSDSEMEDGAEDKEEGKENLDTVDRKVHSPRKDKEGKAKLSKEAEPAKPKEKIRYVDKIRIDAKQVLKEEVKKYSKQERGRRQADQAYIQKDSDSEAVATATVVPQTVVPPPVKKSREIKKKAAKGEVRRVGQSSHHSPERKTEDSHCTEVHIEKDENRMKSKEDEANQQMQQEEQRKIKELADRKEEEERRTKAEEQRVKEEQEKIKRERLEKLEKENSTFKSAVWHEEKPPSKRAMSAVKTSGRKPDSAKGGSRQELPQKRGSSATKPKKAKSRPTSSVIKRRAKPSSTKGKGVPPDGATADLAGICGDIKSEEAATGRVTDKLQVSIPPVETHTSGQDITKELSITMVTESRPSPGMDAFLEGFPKYEVKQDVQTWLESARDDMHGGDSILNKSVTDDKDVSDRRSRSPGMWSDVSVEMTVPHVEIMEKDEDWWRRKGRRRRDVASVTRQNTPASEGRLERPHTAHSIPVGLTTEELEQTYEKALQRFQGIPGTPDYVEKVYSNEGRKFEDNWQDRAIERHLLLKMQRHLRAQSATKKHERLCQEQQDRHRALVEKTDSKDGEPSQMDLAMHMLLRQKMNESAETSQSKVSPSRLASAASRAASIPSRAYSIAGARSERLSRVSSAGSSKRRPQTAGGRIQYSRLPQSPDKAELSTQYPFRCRLGSMPATQNKTKAPPMLKEEIDIRMFDPRNPSCAFFRARSGVSVPSKCSRYVLIHGAKVNAEDVKVMPTVMEQNLINERFPEYQDRWLGHVKPPPKVRPPLILYHPPSFTQHSAS